MELYEKNDAEHDAPDRSGSVPHAVIIWGGSDDDREKSARRMAQTAVCSAPGNKPCNECEHCRKALSGIHPDIITIDRSDDARAIQVGQIRALKEDSVVMPNEASIKIYIILHADSMNLQAQNAILKLLEEPPKSSSFILAADNPAAFLPTVRSRCVEISCKHGENHQEVSGTVNAFYEALLAGGLKMCAFSFTLEKLDKTSFIEFIAGARSFLADKLRSRAVGGLTDGIPAADRLMKAIDVLNRAKDYFDSNIGLVHIAGMICAELL